MANARDFLSQFDGLTLDNVGDWPLIPKVAVWMVMVVTCVALGWFLFWSGQLEEWRGLQAEEGNLKTQFQQKVRQAVNLEELRLQKDQVGQYVLTLERQLPSKAEMDALLSDINQAGVGRGLQFDLFRPGQTLMKDYYAELPITIRVLGRYHDLGAFVSDIANLPRIVTLHNVALQTHKDGALAMDATAKTFRYLDEEELAARRKSDAESKKAKK